MLNTEIRELTSLIFSQPLVTDRKKETYEEQSEDSETATPRFQSCQSNYAVRGFDLV